MEILFPLLGTVVGAVVGTVVGAVVGTVVVVGALVVAEAPPHAASASKRLTTNRQSQALVAALVRSFWFIFFSSVVRYFVVRVLSNEQGYFTDKMFSLEKLLQMPITFKFQGITRTPHHIAEYAFVNS